MKTLFLHALPQCGVDDVTHQLDEIAGVNYKNPVSNFRILFPLVKSAERAWADFLPQVN